MYDDDDDPAVGDRGMSEFDAMIFVDVWIRLSGQEDMNPCDCAMDYRLNVAWKNYNRWVNL